jgi:hypothetical protein
MHTALVVAWNLDATCTVECYDKIEVTECDPQGDVGEHRAPEIGDSHETGDGPHWHCFEGFCTVGLVGIPAKHPECTQSFASILPRLRTGLIEEDSRAIAALAEEYPQFVEVNSERRAVQLIRCDGAVIGHFPVAARMLRGLTE